MDIFQIACIAIVTTVLVLLLQSRPELAMMVGLAGGVLILLQVLPYIANIVQAIEEVAQLAGIEMQYIGIVLKATGIAVLITVCSAVCKDAGQTAIAAKLEIAGRVVILMLSLPVLSQLFRVILAAMQW